MNRYTVSRMPPIRPIQFSALKPLDPLHQEPQRGENNDRQADVEKVEHGSSLCSGRNRTPMALDDLVNLAELGTGVVHAAPMHGGEGS